MSASLREITHKLCCGPVDYAAFVVLKPLLVKDCGQVNSASPHIFRENGVRLPRPRTRYAPIFRVRTVRQIDTVP